jgi:maleate cis-trans isomerase
MTVIGFLYPDHAAEDDYPAVNSLLSKDITLAVEHIYGVDLHAIDELLDLGSPEKLAEGASRLGQRRPDVIIWACTSGSFVYGTEGAHQQARQLAQAADVPASSTSFAFVRAAQSLGLQRVAVAASYPDEVAQRFKTFLGDAGIEVVRFASAGIETAAEVGELPEDKVREFVLANDHPDAEAVLVPDTAMRTALVVESLEKQLGKPVLTANQVTIWHGMRLAGRTDTVDGLGALFRVTQRNDDLAERV